MSSHPFPAVDGVVDSAAMSGVAIVAGAEPSAADNRAKEGAAKVEEQHILQHCVPSSRCHSGTMSNHTSPTANAEPDCHLGTMSHHTSSTAHAEPGRDAGVAGGLACLATAATAEPSAPHDHEHTAAKTAAAAVTRDSEGAAMGGSQAVAAGGQVSKQGDGGGEPPGAAAEAVDQNTASAQLAAVGVDHSAVLSAQAENALPLPEGEAGEKDLLVHKHTYLHT